MTAQDPLSERLHKIERLLVKSRKVTSIEDHVYESTQRQRRIYRVEELDNIMEDLNKQSIKTRQQETYNIRHGVMINTFPEAWYRSDLSLGHIAVAVGDELILQVIRERKDWQEIADSRENRVTYHEEFKARYKILRKKILDGSLDNFPLIMPFTMLHMINGRHGELLEELGIDPHKGITQQRFKQASPIKAKAKNIYGEKHGQQAP